MVIAYDRGHTKPLQDHFPSERACDYSRFEIALAAAGGTSTGAYIAGVLDFLVEAFEEWTKAADAGDAPKHDVHIRTMAGTSAGGLSLAIAAMAGVRAFPHVYDERKWAALHPGHPAPPPQDKDRSPFYRAWVSEITLDRLLSRPGDLEQGEIALFHSAPQEIQQTVFAMIGQAPVATGRRWLSDPLDVRLTVGNLRGMSYALDFYNTKAAQNVDQRMLMHRDHVAFALRTSAAGGTGTGLGPAPDAHELDPGVFNTGPAWKLFGEVAVASAAIPMVFRSVKIEQDFHAYGWRNSYWDCQRKSPVVDLPVWSPPDPVPYDFVATDGGLFDDAPFELARRRLSGSRGRNPREAKEACRAVILIDPIIDEAVKNPDNPDTLSVAKTVGRMIRSPIQQARTSTFDLAEIKDESIYSRFMISPSRSNPQTGQEWGPSLSLMTLPLHAVLGFACRAYREHDFLLGRRNAQRFLQQHFVLPDDHALFENTTGWTAKDYVDAPNGRHRCIIPLRGRALLEEPAPEWRWRSLTDADLERLMKLIKPRLEIISRRLRQSLEGMGVGLAGRFFTWIGWRFGIKNRLLEAVAKGLRGARDGLDPANRKPPN